MIELVDEVADELEVGTAEREYSIMFDDGSSVELNRQTGRNICRTAFVTFTDTPSLN